MDIVTKTNATWYASTANRLSRLSLIGLRKYG
jgi:hypothetical protein